MDKEQHERLVAFIVNGEYPDGLKKSEKFVLRRVSKSYSVKDGRLYCEDKMADGQQGREEVERVYTEYHLSAGGHKGRDATIEKLKLRYYLPNYYKEITEKVKLYGLHDRRCREVRIFAILEYRRLYSAYVLNTVLNSL